MRIGVVKEVKNRETRVALTPAGVSDLTKAGHEVVVEANAGLGSAITDDLYVEAGASIVDADRAWDSELVLKVKEPVTDEYPRLSGQTLFTFLHLAANEPLAAALVAAGTTAFSYDTVKKPDGSLPLLAPMSAVAGRLATLAGAYHLLSSQGGRGVLLSGVDGVPGAAVTVIGAGVAGSNAMQQAVAMGAQVTVLDLSQDRLAQVAHDFEAQGWGDRVHTVLSSPAAIESAVLESDLVIGAVLVPGRRAPRIVTHDMVTRMRAGSVLVDIAIDQGGCFEDSRPTTHDDPVYPVAQSVFYCVANMPGAVGATATQALTHATLPYVHALASGVDAAVAADPAVGAGLNVAAGTLRHPAVIEAFPHLPSGAPAY